MIRHLMLPVFALLLILLSQATQAQQKQAWDLPVASSRPLFVSGNPHPWEHKTAGLRGGRSQVVPEDVSLLITSTRSDSGGGVNYSSAQRFDPKPYLADPCMRVALVFKVVGKDQPGNMKMIWRTWQRQSINSDTLTLDDAQQLDEGWMLLRFAFDPKTEIAEEDQVAGVMVTTQNTCQFQIRSMTIQQYRNVSLHVTNDPLDNLKTLKIKGQTHQDNARVFVKLIDADGKKHMKVVDTVNGEYALDWQNPPLMNQAVNRIFAHVGKGNDVMDQSITKDVFGYSIASTDHLWLSVNGRHIVTSDKAAGGSKPFIASGVGYARNVVIPAQDEEVAAFCKSMGLNTIRLPFYLRYFNNREHEPIDLEHHLQTFVDPVIRAAKRHGLYVILDCHSYFTGQVDEANARQNQKHLKRWSDEGLAEWARRWGVVAQRYKDEPYVMGYELCNEPHDIEPELVREYYSKAREAIRKVDQRHILFVGTCDWSHARALDKTWGGYTQTFDAPYNNTVYAFHDYPTDNHPPIVQQHIVDFMAKYNVPVMCTEFGASWWDHDETVCREFQAGILGVFARQDVGWMVWALKRVENNPRHPHPLPKKVAEKLPKDKRPADFDSCAYSDIWGPIARIMASPFPQAKP
ncbi:MAG: hypothetical protein CMJ19_19990 [Phycisphaeraceae bacterium]|nr:hypothetical protein [Phycisphaeraceae bacterium]